MGRIGFLNRTHTQKDEPKLVACECSREAAENLGNHLLRNFPVTILKAMAINKNK